MKINKSFFKKFLLVAGGFILSLVAIIAVVYTVLNIKWGGELRQELDKLRAAGEPMTMKDITPAPLPPQDNASIEYQQIFTIMTDGTYSMKGTGEESKDMKEIGDICFSGKTMDDFEAQCRKNSDKIHAILEKESIKQILELCRKAASKPGMNFNLNYEEGPSLLLPHIARIRSITRLLQVNAEMELLSGEREKSWETIYTGLKLNSLLKSEPFLISRLVYFACNTQYFDFIAYNLPRSGIGEEQAARLLTELAPEKTAYGQLMKKAMEVERICLGGWVFERLLSGRLDASAFSGLTSTPGIGAYIYVSFLCKPLAKKDYVEYLKIMEQYKAQYDQPFYKIPTEKMIEGKIFDSLPEYCFMTMLLCPGLDRVRLKTAEIETRSQEIRLRLALEIYKNKNGSYPEKLEQLSPDFLKEIPVSEINGKAFEYSKAKDVYAISGGIKEKK